jgi:hypothetical protein
VLPVLVLVGFVVLVIAHRLVVPMLGERLQELRRPGMPRLERPGRSFPEWGTYLDPKRYQPEGARYIRLLWMLIFAPVGLLVLMLGFCF